MARALSAAHAVRARIAAGWLEREGNEARVGRFQLRPTQRHALAAIARAFERHGGALLADPPGTGKTVIALALAARLGETPLIVAPAALRAQWQRAATDAEVEIRFVSFEALGRGASVVRASLVIVDEAHHARTPSTRRYARLAELCVAARVLLLSATPVVNRRADRDSLLALFLGARAAALDVRTLADVVIRRPGDDAARPAVRTLPALVAASDVPGLGEAIAHLPPPLSAADGRPAAELVRIALAMAWRSSLAALDVALRRREQRGMVIRDALADGRWPDRATLRHWLLGDDATQLAFPLELDRAEPPSADGIATIQAHLAAVRALRTMIAPQVYLDTAARAAALSALSSAHPEKRIVCFAQHGATIRALWRALRHVPGVAAITGERVYAAAGRWTRDEVLRALGPGASAVRGDDPRAIRLLLATDLLAEGVDLQGVAIVVHGDAAWTPTRLEQRVGRAVRIGSSAGEVLVTGFRAPDGARALLRLGSRLARKRSARADALAHAEREADVARLLAGWVGPSSRGAVTAVVRGRRRSFVALVAHGAPTRRALIAGRWIGGRWQLTVKPGALARVIAAAGCDEAARDASLERAARQALTGWVRAQHVRAQLGDGAAADTTLWRRLRMRVDRALARVSLAARTSAALEWSRALRTLASAPSIGARHRIAALDRAIEDDREFVDSLVRLANEWRASGPPQRATDDPPSVVRPRLLALLLVEPAQVTPAGAAHPDPSASCLRSASSLA